MNNIIQEKDIKPVRLYVMATPSGFACGIIDEDLYNTEEYYISLTLARGMLRLALKNPDLVFDEGVLSLGEDFIQESVSLDFKEFLEKRKNKLN